VRRARVVVHGHVQGVSFRDATLRRARSENVAGWVRNNPDGTVEAVFEGRPEAVERLLELCRRGPRGAAVDRVDVYEEPPEGIAGFSVR
jgi:acylphosphatase